MSDETRSVLEAPEELVAKPPVLGSPQGEQMSCVEQFEDFLRTGGQVFILTGPAGSGKSYLIPMFEHVAQTRGLNVVICAPTGQAAKRLRAMGIPAKTLHSTLYGRPELAAELVEDRPPSFLFRRGSLPNSTVFIVDEASMIGNQPYTEDERREAEVLFEEGNLLSDLLLNVENAELENRVVFIGDRNQLAPVRNESSQCLEEATFAARGFEVRGFALSQIRRTETESRIRNVADFCADGGKIGHIPDDWLAKGQLSKASTFESTLHEQAGNFGQGTAIAVVPTNALADSSNRVVRAHIYNLDAYSTELFDGVLPGDRIMVARPNLLTPIQTGDELVVESIDSNRDIVIRGSRGLSDVDLQFVGVSFEECGERYFFHTFLVRQSLDSQSLESDISRALWIDYLMRFRKARGKDSLKVAREMVAVDPYFNALRTKYSYARTCHKAQGGEWPTVVVDATSGMSSNPKWGYTAATRAMHTLVIVTPLSARISIDSPEISEESRTILIADFAQVAVRFGITVEFVKSIDHGVQLLLEAKDREVTRSFVNVFFKNAAPSKIAPTGHWSETERNRFNPAIEEFRASIAVSPGPVDVPQPVLLMLERLKQTALTKHDAALVWEVSKQWTVTIVLSQNGRQGTTHFHFGSKKKGLTTEKIDGAHQPNGDPALVELIRKLKESRGF